MAINFPTSPAVNQVYTYNTRTWKWNGLAWDLTNTGTGLVVDSTSNTNYVTVAGSATGASPKIFSAGADTNVGLDLSTKGVNPIRFYTGNYSALQVLIDNITSATNYLAMYGSTGSNSVELAARGSATNVGVNIVTKGTGVFTVNGSPVVGSGGGALTCSTTAPTSPNNGDQWFNLNTGVLYVYTNDGNSSQWVDMDNSGGQAASSVTLANSFTIGDSLTGTKQLNFTNNTGIMAVTSAHTASRTLALPNDSSTLTTQYNLGLRNRIQNGKMDIAQRGGSIAIGSSTGAYTLDRWKVINVTDGTVTATQSTDVPNTEFQSSLRVTVNTADASIAAGQAAYIQHFIEGYNVRDLVGKTITLSFWVKSAKTGIHCLGLRNSGQDYSWVTQYTVNTANTWEQKTITVPNGLITTGTWNWTTGIGLDVDWILATGSTYVTATQNTWVSGNFIGTASQVNVMDTAANIFAITGVQLEAGNVATSFEHRPYSVELHLCQRYYENLGGYYVSYASSGSALQRVWLPWKVTKRTGSPSCAAAISTGGLTTPSIIAARQHGVVIGFGATGAGVESEYSVTGSDEL